MRLAPSLIALSGYRCVLYHHHAFHPILVTSQIKHDGHFLIVRWPLSNCPRSVIPMIQWSKWYFSELHWFTKKLKYTIDVCFLNFSFCLISSRNRRVRAPLWFSLLKWPFLLRNFWVRSIWIFIHLNSSNQNDGNLDGLGIWKTPQKFYSAKIK